MFFSSRNYYGDNYLLQAGLQSSSVAYVEASTDAEITNDNVERRQRCTYLGPGGNRQGSIKCFVIETSVVVVRHVFDVLSYPDAILKKKENWGHRSKRGIIRGRIIFLNR